MYTGAGGLDPNGAALRYPVNLSGQSSISLDQVVISFRLLGETMTKVGNLLDDAVDYLYILCEQDQKSRMNGDERVNWEP